MWQLARKHIHLVLILALATLGALVWYAVWQVENRVLAVSFLDVGQGDAIFIETPAGAQMLIDGGPNRAVLRELSRVMPWYDRTIDVIVATHPDKDHIVGLIDVLERYRVKTIIESGVLDDGADAAIFEKATAKEAATRHVARRGEIINFGDGVRFEILFPDRSLPAVETNLASVSGRLVYGDTAFMLTGDSPLAIEEYLARLDAKNLKSNVLKAGHHGSKTSSSPIFLGFVNPKFGVFSRGCDNRYGHPAPEIVALFNQFKVETRDTCTDGVVTFLSDGQTVQLR